MKSKNNRLDTLRMIISSREMGSQEELLQALQKEGFSLTQATLSRDLKQLKVAKAASMNGNYVYVLPSQTMYKRVSGAESRNSSNRGGQLLMWRKYATHWRSGAHRQSVRQRIRS